MIAIGHNSISTMLISAIQKIIKCSNKTFLCFVMFQVGRWIGPIQETIYGKVGHCIYFSAVRQEINIDFSLQKKKQLTVLISLCNNKLSVTMSSGM